MPDDIDPYATYMDKKFKLSLLNKADALTRRKQDRQKDRQTETERERQRERERDFLCFK